MSITDLLHAPRPRGPAGPYHAERPDLREQIGASETRGGRPDLREQIGASETRGGQASTDSSAPTLIFAGSSGMAGPFVVASVALRT